MPSSVESMIPVPIERRNTNDPSIVGLHLCKMCKRTEREVSLKITRKNGLIVYRSTCSSCAERRKPRTPITEEQLQKSQRNQVAKRKAERLETERRPYYIYWDSLANDRKKGRENDLDQKFIGDQIANGCAYCGEKDLMMTLDRIDNSVGHTKANVLPACIRCNLLRRDMPFPAWRLLIHGLRLAVEHGRFNGWTGVNFRPKKKDEIPSRQESIDEILSI